VLLVHAPASLVPAAGLGVLTASGLAPAWIAPVLLLLLVPAVGFAVLGYRNPRAREGGGVPGGPRGFRDPPDHRRPV